MGGKALQLLFLFELCAFEMSEASFGLMGSAPKRPCDDVCGLDTPLCELDGDTADFLDGPADQECLIVGNRGSVFLGDTALAW